MNRIGSRDGPCTWDALRGVHGASLASTKSGAPTVRDDLVDIRVP